MGNKLLETEKNYQTELQSKVSINNKEDLLNELKQLQKELAQNVSANKKLRHRLEKAQRQGHMEAVKDVGMHCCKGPSNRQESVSSLIDISDAPEIVTGMQAFEKANSFDNMLLSYNYKLKQNSCESLEDKSIDSNHLSNVDKQYIVTESNKREEKTPCNPSSIKKDGDRLRQMSDSTEDSRGQRSHYTSPDLGIESDPAPEYEVPDMVDIDEAERETAKENFDTLNVSSVAHRESHQKRKPSDTSLIDLNKSLDHAKQDTSNYWIDQTLCAVCQLQDYELLKKEIEGSLILMKGIQARIKERLVTMSSKTSPVKSLEYSTLKELSHSCSNVEFYLGKGCHLIGCFWTAPMSKKHAQPSSDEKDLVKENLLLSAELATLKDQLAVQTKELHEAREKINTARTRKEKMEHAISNQLVKTRQVLREAKGNLTESRKHKNGVESQH